MEATHYDANGAENIETKSTNEFVNLFSDQTTPTPPSLTSESSPESFNDQDDTGYEHHVQESPFSHRHSSVAPSEEDFVIDWRHSKSAGPWMSSLTDMADSKYGQSNGYTTSHEDVTGSKFPMNISDIDHHHNQDGRVGSDLSQHPWFPLPSTSNNDHDRFVGMSSAFQHGVMSNGPMLHGRNDTMFTSMIDENHCAPPAVFEASSAPSTSTQVYPQMESIAPMHTETNSIAAHKLMEPTLAPSNGTTSSLTTSGAEADLAMSAAHVIRPDRDKLPAGMEIHVHGLPTSGAKSRVETQIRMRIELVAPAVQMDDTGRSWDRIGSFRHIKVPPLSGTKRKSKKHQKVNVPTETLLLMEADVVNATPPHTRVYVCNSCRERERKRADRKKSKKLYSSSVPTEDEIRALDINPSAPNALELAAERMGEEERKHAVLFNCGDYIDFHDGEAIISTRITCYCRHHREKVGFQIVFTLRGHRGELVAVGSTPPIMIMDDHKSVTQTGQSQRPVRQPEQNRSGKDSFSEELRTSMSMSPQGSCAPGSTAESGSRSRDRAKPYDDRRRSRSGKEPVTTTPDHSSMSFILDPARHLVWNSLSMINGTPNHSNPDTRPALTHRNTDESVMGPVAGQSTVDSCPATDRHLLTTPMQNEPMLPANHTPNMQFDPLFAGLSQAQAHDMQPNAVSSLDGLASLDTEPRITKMIPAEGPTAGGIEITVLGENFTEGLQCVFGDIPCSNTRVWASSTLVCVLPPRYRPGPVIVTLQHGGANAGTPIANQPLQLFTYIDATDRALMELALQVVGLQMTGQMASARDIAMRIVNSSQGNDGNAGMAPNGTPNGVLQANSSNDVPDISSLLLYGLRLCRSHNAQRPSVQDSIIGFLSLLDVPLDEELNASARSIQAMHACNSRGQTLLHLAVMHNFHRLARDLLSRGCPVNAQDANGFTALHFAALHGSVLTSRVLLDHGASPFIDTLDGFKPIDVARRSEMADVEQVISDYMADAEDISGFSDATDSDEEQEQDQELTPTMDTCATITREARDHFKLDSSKVHDASFDDSDSDSDECDDADISYEELAALHRESKVRKAPSSTPSVSPRSSWHFGLLRRPFSAQKDSSRHDDETMPASPTTSQSPLQLLSPPPTYDEATLDHESSTSRHVFGEKLVTNTESSSRLSALLRSDQASRSRSKVLHNISTGTRLRSRSTRDSRINSDHEISHAVQVRRGVYDDRMLLWFWIPAMVSVFLVSLAIHFGPFSYNDLKIGRFSVFST
ncbi:hypothetical protein MYAM1_001044 [Malassezia yamatoensis]|uniref:IPT/TIG domain-containing protein n=1 Tax=Malassezia yamatoensis TaxID=253288 RepID=A0AAJ5YS77_9BASI|nr:hypothetical protein MYAM1_001044 [Malassezia yamatoensis]